MRSDVLLQKSASVRRCLARIQERTVQYGLDLDNSDTFDVVTVNLSRATQQVLDMAAFIIARKRWGLAKTLAENFEILRRHGVLDESLCKRMQKMVGFRNIAVHDYQAMATSVIQLVIEHHLGDLEEFAKAALKVDFSEE